MNYPILRYKRTIFPLISALLVGIYCLCTLPIVKNYLSSHAQKTMEQMYGSVPLSPIYEAKIRAVATELGVEDPIIMRKMNSSALMAFGYHNAFAAFPLFGNILPLVDTPFLFVSEGFFEDLSEQEQLFLIGHELTHIKEHHTQYIQLILILTILALCTLWWVYVRKKTEAMVATHIPAPYQKASLFMIGFLSVWMCAVAPQLMSFWYRRHIERVADHQSLTLLHSYDGGVQLMDRWVKDYKLPSVNPYGGILADHPSCFERRTYCLERKNHSTKEVL